MIMKVKEPIEVEWPRMRPGQVIYTYFHFAADERLTRAVIDVGRRRVAYETVQLPDAVSCRCSRPMSEVAGRMAVQDGAKYLEKVYGGRGVLLGGVPGVAPAEVVILGGGVVGINAAKIAAGLGAHVVDPRYLARPAALSRRRAPRQRDSWSTPTATTSSRQLARPTWWSARCCCPGAKAPHLVRREDLKRDEAGRGHRRRRGRPGRLRRDDQADDARESRPTSSTGSCTTAWPTCRAACRAPPPSR